MIRFNGSEFILTINGRDCVKSASLAYVSRMKEAWA